MKKELPSKHWIFTRKEFRKRYGQPVPNKLWNALKLNYQALVKNGTIKENK
jgi:hypothetical protein